MKTFLLLIVSVLPMAAQYTGGKVVKQRVNNLLADSTAPFKTGLLANRPALCYVGDAYFSTDAASGSNISLCVGTFNALGTWVNVSGSGGSGTVTSVTVNGDGLVFTTSTGGAITISGTATLALATQTANRMFAGPTTGSAAAPTFRAMVKADTPATTVHTDQSNTFSSGTQSFTAATATAPNKSGVSASIPATCNVGETYFKTDATAGSNLFGCTATNTWTLLGGSSAASLIREYIAAACNSGSASLALNTFTTDPPVPDCRVGTNNTYGVAKFADASTLSMHGSFQMPASITTVTLDLWWVANVANASLNAVWQFQTACATSGDSDDPAYSTAQTVTSAAAATVYKLRTAQIASVTSSGCGGKEFFWRIFRDPTHASDTLAATAELKSLRFTVQ